MKEIYNVDWHCLKHFIYDSEAEMKEHISCMRNNKYKIYDIDGKLTFSDGTFKLVFQAKFK